MFRSTNRLALWVLLASVVVAGAGRAQGDRTPPGYYGLGSEVSAAQIAGWDIDVRPDGQGLPPGEGTVDEGDALFQEQCAQCHGVFGEGAGRWPVLVGGEDSLSDDRPEKTIGSYWPYATTLWDYIHRAMPFYNPQSLSNSEVYALTAYLLNMNEIVDEDFVADAESVAAVEMPNRDGFFRDPRPDAQDPDRAPGEPCMENCKNPDDIEITWDASDLGVTPVDHLASNSAAAGDAPAGGMAEAPSGEDTYTKACAACHANGVAGAPAVGDKTAWLKRIGQGLETLVEHAINGYQGNAGYMPPKGGQAQLSDGSVAEAVRYMVEQSRSQDEPL